MDGGKARCHFGAARLAVLLTVGMVSMAGLTACTGEDDPAPPSTTAPSISPASTAPSHTATPPAPPKAEPTAKSAEAFVKYFWDVYNYSYATRDPKLLESISEEQCKFCNSTIGDIKQLHASDTKIDGLTVHLISAAAPPVEDASRIAVVTVIRQDPGRSVKSDGTIHGLTGREETQSLAALHWTSGSWQVRGISVDARTETP